MPTIPEILRGLPPAGRETLLRLMPEHRVIAGNRCFPEWAHGGQVAPPALEDGSDWRSWVLMAGRGFGKTRAGAEWVLDFLRQAPDERGRGGGGVLGQSLKGQSPGGGRGTDPEWGLSPAGDALSPLGERVGRGGCRRPCADSPSPSPSPEGEGDSSAEPIRIALVAATIDEARRVMVEGASGILACAREEEIHEWAPSRRELVFKNGAIATLFSGASPEALRGPQHHIAWCDELAKWRHPRETWDMLQLGLRCGEHPRALVTTTPRGGCAALKRIIAAPDTVQTNGSTRQNPHLPPAFLRAVETAYAGTRLAREEIDGVLLADVFGSLWPAALLEASRGTPPAREALVRIVVGVDPPASAEGTCGIVVCGLDTGGVGHVLGDHSAGGLSPEGWARAVAAAAQAHGADRVVAEKNQGGDMVRAVLRTAGIALPITLVSAVRAKAVRAEPVAGLFECGRARLAGRFDRLEEELAGLVPCGYEGPGKSPDRADAMVWALWALLIAPAAPPRVRAT